MDASLFFFLDQEEHFKAGYGEEPGPLICGLMDIAGTCWVMHFVPRTEMDL